MALANLFSLPNVDAKNWIFCILFWFVVRRKASSGVACLCLSLVSAASAGCYGGFFFTKPDFWRINNTVEAGSPSARGQK